MSLLKKIFIEQLMGEETPSAPTLSLDEQLVLNYHTPETFENVYPHKDWTLYEYQRYFEYLNKGWLTQKDTLDMCDSVGGVMFGFALCDWIEETDLPKYIKSLPKELYGGIVEKAIYKELEEEKTFPKEEKKKKKLKIINSGKNLTD